MRAILTDMLIRYVALISIINPFGIAFVFHARTRALSSRDRRAVATRVGVYSFGVVMVSFLIGSQILSFFGITLPALRIAGGLVVALSGWAMLNAPDEEDTPDAPATRAQIEGMAFFPLTIPLTAGPGTIATAIALGADAAGTLDWWAQKTASSVVVAIAVSATVAVTFAQSAYLSRLAGHEGTRVAIRLSAFLLICIGVQIVLTGMSDVLPGLIAKGVARAG